MPKFDLKPEQISDLATFLHSTIYLASKRNLYKILDIVVGDPDAIGDELCRRARERIHVGSAVIHSRQPNRHRGR